jgi:group I intron endonuclease
MAFGVVYLLTNLANGKYYIGQTRDLKERSRHHLTARRDHNYPINRAVRKHGRHNFVFEILGEAEVGAALNDLERLWIAVSNATDSSVGYNLREGGSVASFNEETRKRMSEAAKNRSPRSPESYRKGAEKQRGKKRPEQSIRMKGHIKSEETRRKLSESHKGKVIPQEIRNKISASLIGRPINRTIEQRMKHSESLRKAHSIMKDSAEYKDNRRKAALVKWANYYAAREGEK